MSERAIGNELLDVFMDAVKAERVRAHAKHGATSMEQAETLDPWRGLILGEEALECGKALNDDRHGEITLYRAEQIPGGLNPLGDPLDKELIQTAAMAFTWWANRRGDRLPAIEPELQPLCTICGLPKSPAHSKTRSGGYLTGHLFSPPPTADEVRAARDLTDLVLHELNVADEPLHPSWVMQPSTPVDKPVDERMRWTVDGVEFDPAEPGSQWYDPEHDLHYVVRENGFDDKGPYIWTQGGTDVRSEQSQRWHPKPFYDLLVPEEDTDAQAADTAQAPGSPGARGQQQGPEQEVQRGPGGQAPDAQPAPGAPEPETVEGAPGWLVVTYSHQCPPECPDLGMVVTEKHWLGRLIHVIPPTCPATGVALVEVSRGHQASRLAGANHIDSRFRRVQ